MSTPDSTLDQDVVFDVLSSPRRRYAISILNRRGEPMELTELAEEVAALEADTTVDELDKQQRKRVYVSLYQTHVPKLEEVGIVDYDPDAGTVTLADDADAAYPWPQYYLAVSVVASTALAAAVLDVSVFAAVPDAVVAGATVLTFLALAAVQYLVESVGNDTPPEIR
jgi:hypothetical protein